MLISPLLSFANAAVGGAVVTSFIGLTVSRLIDPSNRISNAASSTELRRLLPFIAASTANMLLSALGGALLSLSTVCAPTTTEGLLVLGGAQAVGSFAFLVACSRQVATDLWRMGWPRSPVVVLGGSNQCFLTDNRHNINDNDETPAQPPAPPLAKPGLSDLDGNVDTATTPTTDISSDVALSEGDGAGDAPYFANQEFERALAEMSAQMQSSHTIEDYNLETSGVLVPSVEEEKREEVGNGEHFCVDETEEEEDEDELPVPSAQ